MTSGAADRQCPGRVGNLGERPRHVVEVTAEELQPSAGVQVELRPDAVVLVLDPCLAADPAHHLVGIGKR